MVALIRFGVPLALPGGCKSLTILGGYGPGNAISETPNREPPSTRKEVPPKDVYESLNHTKWECKYHVVFIPKFRRKALFGQLRRDLGAVFRTLAERRECS